jgi:hypothetical protein
MQRAVTAASLQQAEQRAARRYDWIEHGKSLTSSCRRNRGVEMPRPRSNM